MATLSIIDKFAGRRVRLTSIIWIAAIAAAALATFFALELDNIWPFAAAAIVPGLVGLVLSPVMDREWAQVTLLFTWIALAVLAVVALAFLPMAILFLCAPAIASLFKRERVLEAMVLSAIAAGASYYVISFGLAPDFQMNETASQWSMITAPVATIIFMISALFVVSYSRKDLFLIASESAANSASDEQTRHNSDVLDVYPGSAFRVDDVQNIAHVTPQAKGQYLYSDEPLEGRSLGDILDLDPADTDALRYAIARAQRDDENQRLICQVPAGPNGSTVARAVQFDIAPAQGGGAYVYLRDVTGAMDEVERLRAQTLDADADARDKDLFFAGVSHELRTPLNAIIGFSDMMRSRLFGPLPGKYSEYADLIHDSGQHMLDLLGDVLDMSKIEAGKYALNYDRFDLADVVRSTIKMVRPQADNAEVVIEPEIADPDGLMVDADRRAVRQILLNLLSNAIKFSEKGEHITVQVSANEEAATLRVVDTGRGMSAEELKEVGKPYAQAGSARMVNNRGTGLGLSLVKSLTEMHDGEFDLASEIGKGTTAIIVLPRERGEA